MKDKLTDKTGNEIGKVTNAKILKQGHGGLNGLVIEFETYEKINNESIVQLDYKDNLKPFNVKEVEVVNNKLLVRAVECGYWARKLDIDKDLDLRNIIGCGVELVTDPEILKQINIESCWC